MSAGVISEQVRLQSVRRVPVTRVVLLLSCTRALRQQAGSLPGKPSFLNIGSAESYGKEQGANSPVSVRAAFAYGTALNWLTSNKRHHVIAGDTTILFWAERPGPEENLLLQVFAGAFGADDLERNDPPGDTQGAANHEARSQRLKGTL